MLIASFPAGPWETNCYLLATEPNAECTIVDPGVGALPGIARVVAEHRLKPVDVLVSHGHLDHLYDVAAVCATYGARCWIGAADRRLLAEPMLAMPAGTEQLLAELTGGIAPVFAEPDEVGEITAGMVIASAGLSFTAIPAPGHTPGSTLFQLAYSKGAEAPAGGDIDSLVLTGDVLFAGSIGRTDLPGGDHATMRQTLRTVIRSLPDTAVVLPGHGQQTTMARERASNPYLQDSFLDDPDATTTMTTTTTREDFS